MRIEKDITGSAGTWTADQTFNDDVLLRLGTGGDIALVLNSAGLSANAELADVIIGTSVYNTSIPANSLIISNITDDGDLVFFTVTGGNSTESFRADADNSGGSLSGGVTGAWRLMNRAVSATAPTLLPSKADQDTGVGRAGIDQLSLIAGGVEGIRITEDAGAIYIGMGLAPITGVRLLLPSENDAVTPTLALGDGDTGWYESSDDVLLVSIAGAARFAYTGNSYLSAVSTGPLMLNVAASATTPTFIPDQSDSNTGIGQAGADQLSLIAGGVEGIRVTESAGAITVTMAGILQSAGATEIGISVNNTSLTVGTLGSLIIPVKTNTGAPNDAAMGNVVGAIAYNSQDNTLEIRDTTADAPLSVGVAGYVIQRSVPTMKSGDGWYHPMQYLEGDMKRVDEARCVVCGSEMGPGDQITMWANGRVRNDDLHAVFGHLHLEREPQFSSLEERVAVLEEANSILKEKLAECEMVGT